MKLETLTLNGKTYDSFAVSDADKQEIAELAAELVEVPEGGGGTGGGEKEVRHIATVNVTTGTSTYAVTTDSDGNTFNLKDVYIFINKFFNTTAGSYVELKINGKSEKLYGTANSAVTVEVERMGNIQKKTVHNKPSEWSTLFGNHYNGKNTVTSIQFWTPTVGVDTTIEIYGVDA